VDVIDVIRREEWLTWEQIAELQFGSKLKGVGVGVDSNRFVNTMKSLSWSPEFFMTDCKIVKRDTSFTKES
jgi:hypothetical protein